MDWNRGRSEALQILVTFGLFLILEDLQKLVLGVQPYSQDIPMQLFGATQIGGIVNYQLLLIALALIADIWLRLLLKKSRIGKCCGRWR